MARVRNMVAIVRPDALRLHAMLLFRYGAEIDQHIRPSRVRIGIDLFRRIGAFESFNNIWSGATRVRPLWP